MKTLTKRKTKFPTPKLVPLDMSLCTNEDGKRGHPEINSKDTYLVLFDGRYFCGTFSPVWFGWTFNGWHAPLQFDPPGDNSSRWQQVWRMTGKKPRKVKIPEDRCEVKGCRGRLKTLKTRYGDPEGLRADRQCRTCGQYYGCSKASLHKMTKAEYEGEVANDW
jgi:hypothetical protein